MGVVLHNTGVVTKNPLVHVVGCHTFYSTAHSHKMETSQMETIPHMETFFIYQMAYYIKQGGFGNCFFSKIP